MPHAATPVAIEVTRGGTVESTHRVMAAIVDVSGRIVAQAGNVELAIFPRSAIKMFQAMQLIETGAADAFSLTSEELALACASHGGEEMHVDRVRAWLARLGLDASRLGCGAHRPLNGSAAWRLVRAGIEPDRAHNNCSGKHAGMLTVARHMGEPLDSYLDVDHPVQQRVLSTLNRFTGDAVLDGPGTDGCGVPTWRIPLRSVALAAARFAVEDGDAARSLRDAMIRHPELVAGTDRCCTAVMRAAPHVIAKTGAEGVYLAAVPERGIGIVLKAEDGAKRAAETALLDILARLDLVDDTARNALSPFIHPVLRNTIGHEVGEIRVRDGWLGLH